MENIGHYSDSELTLRVMNTESLYTAIRKVARINYFRELNIIIDKLYIYTNEQLADLRDAFDGEVEQMNSDYEEGVQSAY